MERAWSLEPQLTWSCLPGFSASLRWALSCLLWPPPPWVPPALPLSIPAPWPLPWPGHVDLERPDFHHHLCPSRGLSLLHEVRTGSQGTCGRPCPLSRGWQHHGVLQEWGTRPSSPPAQPPSTSWQRMKKLLEVRHWPRAGKAGPRPGVWLEYIALVWQVTDLLPPAMCENLCTSIPEEYMRGKSKKENKKHTKTLPWQIKRQTAGKRKFHIVVPLRVYLLLNKGPWIHFALSFINYVAGLLIIVTATFSDMEVKFCAASGVTQGKLFKLSESWALNHHVQLPVLEEWS